MREKNRRRTSGRVVKRCAGKAKSDRWQVQAREGRRPQCMSFLHARRARAVRTIPPRVPLDECRGVEREPMSVRVDVGQAPEIGRYARFGQR